ncbi:Cut8 six-helix bundle-domain-containing protein [Tricharina praecox]|uniref:Cut8 six-helix bundle-domain-containing protein n=1 Tax=Tricharina praecox TaxID=43433 RepID=UPI00221E5E15|nr:Cut8 six-helix bundle-domain-containing protein [Tricharina praecox]KAI5854420.1 Cut8 six-helix bundle-domain-containing protein [Tricharina praecox]
MSALMNPQPLPLHNQSMHPTRHSPARLGGRKRKADEDHEPRTSYLDNDMDLQMGASPHVAPRMLKKPRSNVVQGRPLPLPRLLESVDQQTLKNIIQAMCDRHPELVKEVTELAPRPTVSSALDTLRNYESTYRQAFPYGGNSTGDYAHNRVRPALMELLDALSDYTPHFLPPNESQTAVSLSFLDGATDFIHRLPEWENPLHNYPKQTAYEEITKAWILVIQEAAKRGAGISLQYGGWESKLSRHNEHSGGRMQQAVVQIRQTLGLDEGANGRSQRSPAGFGVGMQSVSVRTW